MPSFFEFFAGGGMARLGLGPEWECTFANDISPMKASAYLQNMPDAERHFVCKDVCNLRAVDLPPAADLVWGSFPCQDLSLAGSGSGLQGSRSGLIWRLLTLLSGLDQAPRVIALENVTGLLTSNGGKDLYDLLRELRNRGYLYGLLLLDAVHFLPQSRPRVFLIAVEAARVPVPPSCLNGRWGGAYPWSSDRLDRLWREAPSSLKENWVWWHIPTPPARRSFLVDFLELDADLWDSPEYTSRLLSLMNPLHLRKMQQATAFGGTVIGALYRRTRVEAGVRLQRVEARFDGLSGCLRTPSGGSSRQRLMFVTGEHIRTRLLTKREAARLMGLPDTYRLPEKYNDAYRLAGDGVAVPVVRWLSEHLLLPLCEAREEHGDLELRYA